MSPELKDIAKKATGSLETALELAFEAGKQAGIPLGVELGVERERKRVQEFLFPPPAENSGEAPAASLEVRREQAIAAGTFMNMARAMLAKDRKRTFSISDASEYLYENYKAELNADQIRSILKFLSRQEEAERVDRGVYRAGPKLAAPRSVLGGA